ncbi:glycoside hydrolase family 2 protein [Krasilnikovia sp. MM14-A1259]|uniref:glycoside hydrolase family 2 protein n=1 Tax=Krasilnikovia sp. MM14-A1259 TaxID=3373539 RepID=UPI003808C7CD
MTNWTTLHDGWTVSGAHVRAVPATVPGCVHTDLLAAGVIADPFRDANERDLAWIGHTDWTYETVFAAGPSPGRVDLVCAGLDTIATVTVNDVEVGRTANMHRGYRFDVRAALRAGQNRLRIRFGSPYTYARAQQQRIGNRPCAYPEPFAFIRKMACNFGWDWGPTLVTAGIWQDIGLHRWRTARLAQVRPQVTVADGVGRVEVHVRLERDGDTPVTVRAAAASRETSARIAGREAVLTLTVPDPGLWWPIGYGDQPLYELDVTLSDGSGTLDTWSRRIGFRTVRLDTDGGAHTLVVNGVPVFARGVNWIPDDALVTRITRDRLATRLRQAADAGVNYVRVWGGGRYESEDFYELADALGLLIGQDFLFACAAYPEEEPFATEVEAEAGEHVVRLAAHPSLALWTGNNENLWGHADWGWPEELGERTWGARYYFDVLPRIAAELDPTRPYWPGSPYSGRRDLHPNDPGHGTMHIWDVWNTDDYTKFRQYRPRFVAEFGFQAPPTYATLRRAISDDPLAPDSPGMAHHQKAADGDAKLRTALAAHLPAPRGFDDWHYLTQLNQARAITCGIEHFRSLRPWCMGAVVWQLNDCWPVTSWAAIDGDGRRKPLWYALRRAFADRLLTIQPRDGGLALIAVNDGREPWPLSATVSRRALTGESRARTALNATVAPGTAVSIALPTELATPDDPTQELLVAEAAHVALVADSSRVPHVGDDARTPPGADAARGPAAAVASQEFSSVGVARNRLPVASRAVWFFAEDKDIAWPAARYDTEVSTADGVTTVAVTARTILRDLMLFPDRLDPAAEVDDLGLTLLPGESVAFTVSGASGLGRDALTTRPVLRCVNDL